MQAASCLREGEYCLIRVSVIIVGYVPSNLGKQGHSSLALAPTLRVTIFTRPDLPPS